MHRSRENRGIQSGCSRAAPLADESVRSVVMFDPALKVPRIIALLVLLASFTGVSSSQEARAPRPPQPFQRFAVSPSAPVRFLLSDRGRELLRHSPAPQAAGIRRAL